MIIYNTFINGKSKSVTIAEYDEFSKKKILLKENKSIIDFMAVYRSNTLHDKEYFHKVITTLNPE